jgi:hypothetical protein
MQVDRRFGRSVMIWACAAMATFVAVGGCGALSGKDRAEPASERTLEEVRETYERGTPGTRVGRVVAVEESVRLAAVADMTADEVREGDLVAFIDPRNQPLVGGTVVAKVGAEVHVRYYEPRAERRPPRVGDFAVRLPQ